MECHHDDRRDTADLLTQTIPVTTAHRLNQQLYYTRNTPGGTSVGWLAFPYIMMAINTPAQNSSEDYDMVLASDADTIPDTDRFGPFTQRLNRASVVPDSFLGGSAPLLRSIILNVLLPNL